MQERVKAQLLQGGIENAAHEARLLCEYFSGEALEAAVMRRIAREPLQYILGEWNFWNEEYRVSEDCLIPRPDTEHLVERAVRTLPNGARFLDLCTGSGCVAISTLATRGDTTAIAVDLFEKTLALARENAVRNGVDSRLELRQFDVLTLPDRAEWGEVDAILSNPPYIREAAMQALSPEVQREPRAALYGGDQGFTAARRAQQLRQNRVCHIG